MTPSYRGYPAVRRALERKLKEMSQSQVALEAKCSLQAVNDMKQERRGAAPRLLKWLGFELAYSPLKTAEVRDGDAEPAGVESSPAQ